MRTSVRKDVHALARVLVAALALAAPAAGRQAGVATSDAAATDAAFELLEAGGNAVDAAVGAALALAVAFPEAGNLGGGGFAVVRMGDEVAALDFREVAPAAASAGMYLDESGAPRPGASTHGPLAAGVPGSPAGYHELHRRFGRLPWRRVVEPAIRLARDGFVVSWETARSFAEERDQLASFAETAATWLPDGRPIGAGERVRLPTLALVLEAYAEEGPDAIVRGAVAEAIAAASRRHGGVLTARDLAAYRPTWREPLRFERFGWSFAAMPLPSSGGQIVAETLGLLERRGAFELPRDGADRTQLLIEALRQAFADRFELGDPAGDSRALDSLLAAERLDALARALPLDRARDSRSLRDAEPPPEPSETTNLSVLDAEGNMVALTTTLNHLFGCTLWVPEAGFFLNNEMDDFTTAPGRPNLFGLVQGPSNRIHPGRRPLSSMSPTVAWRDEERVVLGGRGGSRIPTSVVQVLLNLFAGDSAVAATARPRIHHQWLPDSVYYEVGALPEATIEVLRRRGHEMITRAAGAEINVVRRGADGRVEAGGDPRAFEVARVAVQPDREEPSR